MAWLRRYARLRVVLPADLPGGRRLRLLDESDAPALFAVIDRNREHLAEWMPWVPHHTSAQQTLAFIRASRRQVADNNGLQAAIVDDGQIVGIIGFHSIDWGQRRTTIGYWLDAGQQGRGTMTEAVRTLVDQALVTWRLRRVEIRAAVENHRSRAIPERLGFRQEGVLRQAERIGDRYVDHVVYAMDASQWTAGDDAAA
jgi:ribosomal-protein-serine acetyltransferase